MCERQSVQQTQFSHLIQEKEKQIKQLTERLDEYDSQFNDLNQKLAELNDIKKSVKKLPYRIYKEFLINTQQDGTIIDLIKQKSIQQTKNHALHETSVQKINNQIDYQKYLLLKIKGEKQVIYLGGNVQISTLDQLKLNQISNQSIRNYQTFEELHQKQQKQIVHKQRIQKIKLQSKIFDYLISQIMSNPLKNLKSKDQYKENIPLNSSLKLQKKQSLPLRAECDILSQDLKKLRDKISLYMTVLQQKTALPALGINDLSQIAVVKDKTDQEIQQKINEINNFDILTQSKWAREKQQYINYIRDLQKQVQKYRNNQSQLLEKIQKSQNNANKSLSTDKNSQNNNEQKNQIKNNQSKANETKSIIDLLFRTPGTKNQISSQQTQYPKNQAEAPQKHNIFKSQVTNLNDYHKNQYHINQESKTRQKSKGSKIFYIRR